MRCVVFAGPRGERVETRELATPAPGTREVLVGVTYAGVNPSDVLRRGRPDSHGVFSLPSDERELKFPGIEVAGTVIATGPLATRWAVGQRVMGLVDAGGLADHVVVPEQQLVGVPGQLDDQGAAATPECFITAHDALASCASTRPASRVLVTGANGGVGSAALQIARTMGAETTGTARGEDGRTFIESLGAAAISHDSWLDEQQDHGTFDVIIELIAGASVAAGIRRLAPRGTLVSVGGPEGRDVMVPLAPLSTSRGRIVGTSLHRRNLEEKAQAIRHFADEVLPFLGSGRVVPHIDSIFPWGSADQAFDRLNSRGKRGKVLLSFE